MTDNTDARPFVDLQKDAEEFQSKFEDDITKCKNFLDAKITALICDPDSLGNSSGPKQNALVEFSKAKYDIFISVKSLINDMEREWLKYISEMKKLFLENVEIFLAGTKLEIKLPSSEYQASPGPKKSPGYKNSTVSSSVYPIINSITSNIPVFSSPLRSKGVQNTEHKALSAFSQRSKYIASEMEIEDTKMDFTSWSSSRSRKSSNLENYGLAAKNLESENEVVKEKPIFIGDNVKGQKSRSPGQDLKRNILRAAPLNGSDVSDDNEEVIEPEQSSLNSSDVSDDDEEIIEPEQYISQSPSPVRGHNGQLIAKNRALNSGIFSKNVSRSENQREANELESAINSSHVTEGRNLRRKQLSENNKDDIRSSRINSRKSICRTTSRSNTVVISENNDSNTSDESGEGKEIETNDNVAPLKGRRGRQTAKSKANIKTQQLENKVTEAICEEGNGTSVVPKTRRGRSRVAKDSINISDNITQVPGRSVSRKSVGERIIETEISLSPKKVTFTVGDDDYEDNLVVCTPVARPTKSAARRKTLLPNIEESVSVADIIPANHSRARSKRKTISGVSDLASVAPSKRLKSNSSQKKNAAAEDEGSVADDNLLETNDSYSEWISLKSIDGKIPAGPAIYEVKVWRAKKSAYIGFCDSLRQKLTVHKLRHNSGHKHLDKFIERNYDDIQIRYEVVSSMNDAKTEVKHRINSFVGQHKTTPAYN